MSHSTFPPTRSVHQWIVGLVLVDRAGLGLKARDQAKGFDRERFGAEPGGRRKKRAELVERRVVQPRQADVRGEFTRLRRQAGTDQGLLYLVAQDEKLRIP